MKELVKADGFVVICFDFFSFFLGERSLYMRTGDLVFGNHSYKP